MRAWQGRRTDVRGPTGSGAMEEVYSLYALEPRI
jgi:hypothetical protein